MKIKKLYTLSQFVDYLDGMPDNEFKELLGLSDICHFSDDDNYRISYELIASYNDFLKQPLKKEMFVNLFGNKPNQDDLNANKLPKYLLTENYIYDLELWSEAEKKVIFEGFKIEYSNYKQVKREIIWMNHKREQLFLKLIYPSGKIEERETEMSVNDLADATNGELLLKNINI